MAVFLNQDDDSMREVLSEAKTIAVVGHSDNAMRTSYQIAQYLRGVGYTVYPVNPTVETIDGEISYASLADVPVPIDIVNVFRRSEYLAGVDDESARQTALDADIHIATNRCIKVEHRRLGV